MNADLATKPDTMLAESDANLFRENFNKQSFEFHHHLATHPLFELPRLCELGDLLSKTGSYYFNAGNVAVDETYDEAAMKQFSLEDVIRRIESSSAWIVLKSVQQDPDYRILLDDCMAEIERFSDRNLRDNMRDLKASIVVTSPRRVTLYHIDSDCNFLFQIRGSKTFSTFDQNDRAILSEEEIERYYLGDQNGAKYRDQFQNRATVYQMTPGNAVHVPVLAPHWAKNNDNVSVSLSINFELLAADRRANVYRFNHYLRRAGLKPQAPGHSALRDSAKQLAFKGLNRALSFRARLKPARRKS